MVNPWTMGAILHEVSHNLQNELQLEQAVPSVDPPATARGRHPGPVVAIWVRWNREIFGDMVGCMLGGEAFVASLMDVIGRAPAQASATRRAACIRRPYLRTFLSCELLRRMGFAERAAEFRRAWRSSTRPRAVGAAAEAARTADRGDSRGRGGRLLHAVRRGSAARRCATSSSSSRGTRR